MICTVTLLPTSKTEPIQTPIKAGIEINWSISVKLSVISNKYSAFNSCDSKSKHDRPTDRGTDVIPIRLFTGNTKTVFTNWHLQDNFLFKLVWRVSYCYIMFDASWILDHCYIQTWMCDYDKLFCCFLAGICVWWRYLLVQWAFGVPPLQSPGAGLGKVPSGPTTKLCCSLWSYWWS